MDKKVLGVVLAAVIVSGVVVAAVSYYWLRIHSSGTIITIGVEAYADANLSEAVSSIDWGVLPVGGSSSVEVWIYNSGDVAVRLELSTENFVPVASDDMLSLSWDYDGDVLDSDCAVHVALLLVVSAGAVGVTDFSFDVVIKAVSVNGA